MVPNQCLREQLPERTRRLYRWIEGLAYVDSEGRRHTLPALLSEETSPLGEVTPFAWLTDLPLNRQTVLAVANQGGRLRSTIENEGFNVQTSSCWRRAACCAPWHSPTLKPPSPVSGAVRTNSPSACSKRCAASSCPTRPPNPPAASASSRTPPERAGCGWAPGSSALRPAAADPFAAAATALPSASPHGQPTPPPACPRRVRGLIDHG